MLLILAISSSLALSVLSQTPPTVDLGYAKYQGFVDPTSGNVNFLGIRFAAPPTGALRWRPPQLPAVTTTVLTATTAPAQCNQAGAGSALTSPFLNTKRAVANNEDCLFLSVYAPGGTITPGARLPVLVWIHGGGYVAGGEGGFNGNDLIKDGLGGVVVVTIQYRLGLFGFLPGKAVKAGGTLNVGLLDQNFALQWVQSHITQFGGNPQQVTIWGESAGAGSVLQHVIAHGGHTVPPLFRGAMTSSTFLPSQYNFDDPIPEQLFSEVVTQTNCTSAADALTCLRSVPQAALETVNTNINAAGFSGLFVFVPVIDGQFIVERPTVTIQRGILNGQALLAMTNTFEGAAFVNPATATSLTSYITNTFPNFTPQQVQQAANQYTNIGLTTPLAQAIGVQGEAIFICPSYYLLNAFSGRSFKGLFAIPPGGHGEDVQFYFTSQNANPPFNNAAFIKAFSQAFLDFSKFLNTNVKVDPTNITPTWPTWIAGRGREMLFNETTAGQPDIRAFTTDAGLLERCRFWESVGASTAQ